MRGCREEGFIFPIRSVACRESTSRPTADVAVFCGPRVPDAVDPQALTNPTLVAEVISPGTEAYYRGKKFAYYRSIRSLRQYVLVGSSTFRVEVFTRNPDESWTLRAYGPGATAALDPMGLPLSVDVLYEGVALAPHGRLTGG